MLPYLTKRFAAMIPTLLGITLITFLIVDLAPGDPIAASLGVGEGAGATEGGSAGGKERIAETVKAKKQLLGILAKDPAVRVWHAAARTGSADVAPLSLDDRLSPLPDWPRVLTPGPQGSLFAATDLGAIALLDTVD